MNLGQVLLRRFVGNNKNVPLITQVKLLDNNPAYLNIRYPDEWEFTAFVHDLAPCPKTQTIPSYCRTK
uniref:Uncharacterized protein n=1 Tax=Octopus bimaculoides TaxID=37653 RepID=A0A0L8G0H1_OCTBM